MSEILVVKLGGTTIADQSQVLAGCCESGISPALCRAASSLCVSTTLR